MKNNKKTLKNTLLSIGSVALATLPFVSVVSCSDNKGSGKPEGGNPGNPGGPQPPQDNKEYLDTTFVLPTVQYDRDGWVDGYENDLLQNFPIDVRNKIQTNKIKFFDEKGNPIKYKITINFNAGLTTSNNYGNPNKPYSNEENNRNVYKIINNPTSTSFVFHKKTNDNHYGVSNFVVDNPIDDGTISILDPYNTICIKGSHNDFECLGIRISSFLGNSILILSDVHIRNINEFSNIHFSSDSPTNNYFDLENWIDGEPSIEPNDLIYHTNLSGTVTIKPLDSK